MIAIIPSSLAGHICGINLPKNQPARSLNYVTFTMEEGIEQLDIVYHEYVHLVVNNNITNVPLWFNEGLAEYYRTFQITANGTLATLGKVDADHVLLLRDHFIPLADLVKVDHTSPLYNETARSWPAGETLPPYQGE